MLHDLLERNLPQPLEPLVEIALDLRSTETRTARRIWTALDPETWERTENPYLILLNAHQERLEAVARDPALLRDIEACLRERREETSRATWFGSDPAHATLGRVAYFSMEFGLSEALPIYSGGLGMLAGDHLRSASDLGVPLIGVGLLYQQGYFRQVLSVDGRQLEAFPYNDPSSMPLRPLQGPDGRWIRVRIELPGRTLLARTWEVRIGRVRLLLLDSNDPQNTPWDRAITSSLYDAGANKRLLQEILLGVGGWQLLEKLGLEVDVCHLNEGHAAFAVLARAASFAKTHGLPFEAGLRVTRAGNVFTTHTPVEAAFDRFAPDLVARFLSPVFRGAGLTTNDLLALGRCNPGDPSESFNMAYLAIRGSAHVNGVSRLHAGVSRQLFGRLFPGRPLSEIPVGHVTNGVHLGTWDGGPVTQLWGEVSGLNAAYELDSENAAMSLARVSNVDLWKLRADARAALVEYVRRRLQRQVRERGGDTDALSRARQVLDPDVLTLGFARRFTEYKRPNLLLHDADRLAGILRSERYPVQLIVAGKAHPNDSQGKAMVESMARFASRADLWERVVFLDDYDMVLAQHLTAGVDVWLNHPRRPAEACGTSGMKILANGGLHFSTLDGWWDEAFSPDVGWALGDRTPHGPEGDARDAEALYTLLEHEISPAFYLRDTDGVPRGWVERIRASMERLTPAFASHRMVREYVDSTYISAAEAVRERMAAGGAASVALEHWSRELRDAWPTLHFGELHARRDGDSWVLDLCLYLGEVAHEWVSVELFSESPDLRIYPMECRGPIAGTLDGYRYDVSVPADRPEHFYTPRVVPSHPLSLGLIEHAEVLWQK